MQLWIYEASGDIEYHFGPSNVTQPFLVYDSIGAIHGLVPDVDLITGSASLNSIFLEGSANNPIPFKDSTLRVVNGTPSNGTVYHFINGGNVSLNELTKMNQLSFSVFPNPTTDYISIDLALNDLVSTIVSIYDINGKFVSIKGFEKTINISDLEAGTYFLEIITKDGRGIAKFMKQ